MLIGLSFNGVLRDESMFMLTKFLDQQIINPDGCPISLTVFLSDRDTRIGIKSDYSLANKLYWDYGVEIGVGLEDLGT